MYVTVLLASDPPCSRDVAGLDALPLPPQASPLAVTVLALGADYAPAGANCAISAAAAPPQVTARARALLALVAVTERFGEEAVAEAEARPRVRCAPPHLSRLPTASALALLLAARAGRTPASAGATDAAAAAAAPAPRHLVLVPPALLAPAHGDLLGSVLAAAAAGGADIAVWPDAEAGANADAVTGAGAGEGAGARVPRLRDLAGAVPAAPEPPPQGESPSPSPSLSLSLSPRVRSCLSRNHLYGLGAAGGGDPWRCVAGWHEAQTLMHRYLDAPDAAAAAATATTTTATTHVAIFGGSFNPITRGHLDIARGVAACGAVHEVWVVPCGPRPDKPSVAEVDPLHRHAMTLLAVEEAFALEGASGGGAGGGGAGGGSGASSAAPVPVRVMPLELDEPEMALASYELMRRLAALFPPPRHAFHLVIGADLAPSLHTWRHAQRLLREVSFLCVPREGYADGLASVSFGGGGGEGKNEGLAAAQGGGGGSGSIDDAVVLRAPLHARLVPAVAADLSSSMARAASVAAQLRARAAGGGEEAEDRAVADALRPLLPASVVDYIVLNKLYRAKA